MNLRCKQTDIRRFCLTLILLGLGLLWIMPLFQMFLRSVLVVKEDGVGMSFSMVQYRTLLIESPTYLNMYWNSIEITVAVVVGSVILSLLGAYGFTVLSFKGKESLFFFYLVVMLLPLQVTLMPNYLVATMLHIEESYLAIILPAIFNPFGVFLMRKQMEQIPKECMEAAKVDGAGETEIFFHIFLPMVRSGIMALVMLLVIEYWNIVDQVILFIRQPQVMPLSVFLDQISRESKDVSYGASVFYVMPIIALVCYGHEYLKEGIGMINRRERR